MFVLTVNRNYAEQPKAFWRLPDMPWNRLRSIINNVLTDGAPIVADVMLTAPDGTQVRYERSEDGTTKTTQVRAPKHQPPKPPSAPSVSYEEYEKMSYEEWVAAGKPTPQTTK